MTLNNENYNTINYQSVNIPNYGIKSLFRGTSDIFEQQKGQIIVGEEDSSQQFYQNDKIDDFFKENIFLREVAKIRFNTMAKIDNIDRLDMINKVLAILREKTKQIAKNQLAQYKMMSNPVENQFSDRQQILLALQRKSMRLEEITQKYAQLNNRYNELQNKNKQLEAKYLRLKRKSKHVQKRLLETTKQEMFNQSTIFNLKGQLQLIKLQNKKENISCLSRIDQEQSPNVLEFYIPKKQQPTQIEQEIENSKNISCTQLKAKPPLFQKYGYLKINKNNNLNLSSVSSSLDSIKNPKFERKPMQSSKKKLKKNFHQLN